MGLKALDLFLTLLHFVIILFNLFGWIWRPLRKAHLICVAITAGCWFILGIWYGIGYCPVTEWQWQVKTQLGETNLPDSFIKYFADKISGISVSESLISVAIGVCFGAATLLSIYFNFLAKKRTRPANQ